MKVELLTADNIVQWESFYHEHPEISIFYSLAWRDLLKGVFNYPAYCFLVRQGRDVIGIASFFLVRSAIFGNRLISVPFSDKGGVYFGAEVSLDQRVQALRCIINALMPDIQRFGIKYVEMRGFNCEDVDVPGARLIRRRPYCDFVIDLTQSMEELRNAFSAGLRWRLSKCEGFKARRLSDRSELQQVYEMYCRDIRKFGTPLMPKKYFEKEWEKLREKRAFEVFTLEYEGNMVAAITLLISGGDVQGELIMSDRRFDKLSPKTYLFYETMRWAKENGALVYRLGRTRPGSGVYEHKRRWGGQDVPIDYCCIVFDDRSNVEMDLEQKCFDWPIALMKTLPLPVLKVIGPYLRGQMGK